MATPPASASGSPIPRTQVRRLPDRGAYDRDTIDAILGAGFLCHLGFVADGDPDGYPVVLPTAYGRSGDQLFFHGSSASHMLRSLAGGVEVCCTVTLLDGIVLARSVFHHSMNYRSVVVFGRATVIEDPAAKLAALEIITENIFPGRWSAARHPTPQELKATLVLTLPLTESSAKVRSGPPKDEPADYALPIWAGVVPTTLQFADPIADPRLGAGIQIPPHVRRR